MKRRPTTQDITWLLDLARNDQLNLDPPYQRRSVWTRQDRQFFLDTIFRDFPSPAIFLHKTISDDGKVTYQIKALLEHAELSIQEAVKLSLSDALAKSDNRTIALRSFILLVNDLWGKENLPSDIRRLAQNIMTLANLVKLDANALRLLLDEEKAVGRGPLIGNLSPYGAVLQTLIYRKQEALNSALKSKQKKVVLIPAEVDLPKALNTIAWEHSAVFIRPV